MPYQNRWIDDESPLKVYEKSRRIGITYASSYRCFRKCMTRQNFTQWVSSRDMLTAKEFISDYIARWCRLAKVVTTGTEADNIQTIEGSTDVKAFVVEFPMTNSRIISLSSNPSAFAGKGGDVLLEEVDLHDDAGSLLDMAMPVITWGGQLEISSAYRVDGSQSTVFARLCQQCASDNPMHASYYRTTLMDAIGQGFVDKVNLATGKHHTIEQFIKTTRSHCRTEAAWQSQFMCNPQDDGGSLLTYQLLANCEATPSELQTNRIPTAAGYLGIDIGRTHDMTVMWLLRRVGDIYWTDRVIVLPKTMFREQLAAAADLMRDLSIVRCCIDATGIGAMLAEEMKLRFRGRVEEIKFTAPVKLELAMPLIAGFEDRTIRIPMDSDIREDLHKVRRQTTSSGNVRLEADSDDAGHADRFWALALARHAAATELHAGPMVAYINNERGRIIQSRRDRSVAA